MSNKENIGTRLTQATKNKSFTLSESVFEAIETYLSNLEGHKPTNLYQMVQEQVESSLFHTILKHTNKNQCKTAAILGISRGTLRKKIKQYKLD
jgi:Fis family transcriptional regulator, factor for inversion stimulation protein